MSLLWKKNRIALISYNVVRILLAGFCLLLLPPILFHYSYWLQVNFETEHTAKDKNVNARLS